MRYLLTLAFFLNILSTSASIKEQLSNETESILSNDQVFVDLSQHVLVSGQALNFKAYIENYSCPNNISISKVLYFEIIDHAYRKVFTWRSNANNGLAYGSVTIPDTISGGLYSLRAFTSWMRNFGTDNFFTTPVIITHLTDHKLEKLTYPSTKEPLFISEQNSDSVSERTTNKTNREPTTDVISIHLSKSSYHPNEKVRIELSANIPADETLNLSVSVFENSSLERLVNTPIITDCFQPKAKSSSTPVNELKKASTLIKYPMESEGYLLSGTLLNDSTKKPIENAIVYLTKIDSLVQFKYDETNNLGKFGFLVNNEFDNHQLILQAPQEINKYTCKWTLDSKWDNPDLLADNSSYKISETEEVELENIRKTELIKKLYQKGEINVISTENSNGNNFYFNPDYIVKPSDYEELNDFNDISDNILPLVRFKKTRKGYSFYLILKELAKMDGYPPGLFLNGMPFFNFDYIAPLNSNDISHVEVCTHPIMYGNLTYYGIVSVFTKSYDLKPAIFKNPIHIIDNKVVGGTRNNILINRQTVFFTPCIYWNPDISITGNKTEVIEFILPNIETEYLVRINGITAKGAPYSKTLSFKIKN